MKCAVPECTSHYPASVYVVQQVRHNGIIEHKDIALCSTCAYTKIMKDKELCRNKQ